MYMNGIIMHKRASRQQGYLEVPNIGGHGIKSSSRLFAVHKHLMAIGRMENIFHGDTDIYRTTMTILMLEVYYRYMPSTKV